MKMFQTTTLSTRISNPVGHLIWTTAQGKKIPINQMETTHLFNAMKMCFNHLAHVWGGIPIWFNHMYEDYLYEAEFAPNGLATIVMAMLDELGRRTDIPEAYEKPLARIRQQVYGREM